jgi:hypothetical protein
MSNSYKHLNEPQWNCCNRQNHLIDGKYGVYVSIDDGGQDAADISLEINDGTFIGTDGALTIVGATATTHNWDIAINGGQYSSDITSYLDTNEYESKLNLETGYYEVTKKNA